MKYVYRTREMSQGFGAVGFWYDGTGISFHIHKWGWRFEW